MSFFTTALGRLRLLGFLEGLSLLLLVGLGMPRKYFYHDAALVKDIGPVHGGLFLLYLGAALYVSYQQRWRFWHITWKVLLACFIPFGTFYVDYLLLAPLLAPLQGQPPRR